MNNKCGVILSKDLCEMEHKMMKKIIVINYYNPSGFETGNIIAYTVATNPEVSSSYSVVNYDVDSKEKFKSAIEQVPLEIQSNDVVFIEIDSHGCNEGLGTNKDYVYWQDLVTWLKPLQGLAKEMYLLISSCSGFSFVKYMQEKSVSLFDGIIASNQEVNYQYAITIFPEIYQQFATGKSFAESVEFVKIQFEKQGKFFPFTLS